ncbi:MAG: hypothetical protein GZ091_17245, partial [Paludibacter sp.]|nr:hypothetical protein [Paludibacter sp.]
THFFALTQKSKQKKSRDLTRPSDTLSKWRGKTDKGVYAASLEKLVVFRLKTFKLAPTENVGTKTEKFSTPTSLHFSAYRTRSVVKATLCKKIIDKRINIREFVVLRTIYIFDFKL